MEDWISGVQAAIRIETATPPGKEIDTTGEKVAAVPRPEAGHLEIPARSPQYRKDFHLQDMEKRPIERKLPRKFFQGKGFRLHAVGKCHEKISRQRPDGQSEKSVERPSRAAAPCAPLRVAATPGLDLFIYPSFGHNGVMSQRAILGPEGAIARRLQNYEPRPEQLELADAVADAIATPQHLMVEAGTGVGKSFAYLVPAIQAALKHEDARVVISTHTISLQEQLVHKDIPFLQQVMPEPFEAALVKGRANYLSRRRLRVANERRVSLLDGFGQTEQLDRIQHWTKTTQDGSRSDLAFRPDYAVWELVESDSGNCLGRKCSDYSECFYFKARARVHQAKLLIVNHALFCCDLAMRRESEFGVLPKYDVAIIDEAHTFEDVAAEHLGLQVTRGQIEYLLNRLYLERRQEARGLLTSGGSNEAMEQVQKLRDRTDEFFQTIAEWLQKHQSKRHDSDQKGSGSCRVRETEIVTDVLSGELETLANLIVRDADNMRSEELKIEFTAAASRCKALASAIRDWLGQNLADQVYWIDVVGKKISLASAPIDVGPVLRELLFDKVPSVILTSATLSVGGDNGFSYFQKRLGFPDDCPTLQLGSPFDYRKQAELHLFPSMPDPKDSEAFERASLIKIRDYVLQTGGRTFVLFTSNQAMTRAAKSLRGWLADKGIRLLCQSDGMPPGKMVQEFKQTTKAVLFGVTSFWQGVDVQGDALRNVIITRLPFFPPDRPVVQARTEAIDRSGGQSFLDYQVPQAVIRLKQGFGRLIRTRSDTGMVVILDPRVVTKAYGHSFLEALPPCRRFVDGVEQ